MSTEPQGAIQYDLYIEQGTTFEKVLKVQNYDGTAKDFTGYTARCQVRKTPSAADVIATPTVVVDGPAGIITLSLTAVQTAAIPVLKSTSYTKLITRYAWDLELVDGDGKVSRLLEGVVKVSPEVTRG